MAPTVLAIDPEKPDPSAIAQAIAQAVALLQSGQLVAFPTETVYGLGANALDADAVARIFEAKGRPAWNPVITHVADTDAARALARDWPANAQRLAERFWPGPISLVVAKHPDVPDIVTAGHDSVAIRVPAHPVALALLRAVARPLAAPSANRFTQVSPTTAAHVVQSLGDRVPLVIDGGTCDVGIESTIVDLTSETPTILRPGSISQAQIEATLQRAVNVASSRVRLTEEHIPGQRAPGGAERHYAPRAEVWLFDPEQIGEIQSALENRNSGSITALLRTTDLPPAIPHRMVRMPADPDGYARALYAALHDADAQGAALVLVERPPDFDSWRAIRDRLTRAAR